MLNGSGPDSFLEHALALEYIKINEFEKAIDLFRAVLQRDPGYVGSYYHLGKLHEKMGNVKEALDVYQAGMNEARKAKDNHSYNELNAAFEDLND